MGNLWNASDDPLQVLVLSSILFLLFREKVVPVMSRECFSVDNVKDPWLYACLVINIRNRDAVVGIQRDFNNRGHDIEDGSNGIPSYKSDTAVGASTKIRRTLFHLENRNRRNRIAFSNP
jgi:hypothetical protein